MKRNKSKPTFSLSRDSILALVAAFRYGLLSGKNIGSELEKLEFTVAKGELKVGAVPKEWMELEGLPGEEEE